MMGRDKQLIGRDSEIMFGKPIILGTRITVEHVLRLTAQGLSIAEIVEEHPDLSAATVKAALDFAANYLHDAFPTSAEAAE